MAGCPPRQSQGPGVITAAQATTAQEVADAVRAEMLGVDLNTLRAIRVDVKLVPGTARLRAVIVHTERETVYRGGNL